MSKLPLALVACLLAANAVAEGAPTVLTGSELRALLPGAKVTHITQGGSERHWTNNPDGTLFATTNNKVLGNALGTQPSSHAGTWTVNDRGQFCIDIDWSRLHEKWCATVLQGDGNAYYLNVADDKHRILFEK